MNIDALMARWAARDQWLEQYREAHPDDDRSDADILLDETVSPEACREAHCNRKGGGMYADRSTDPQAR